MTFVVAFDNSPLSRAALDRATRFATTVDEDVVAVTAVPRDAKKARERGWLGRDTEFSVERVTANLQAIVTDLDPGAGFAYRVVDRYAPRGRVSRAIRELAVERDASVVFIGSDNAGRMVGGISSVGQTVSSDDRYDVHIVRHPRDQ